MNFEVIPVLTVLFALAFVINAALVGKPVVTKTYPRTAPVASAVSFVLCLLAWVGVLHR